MFEEFFGRDPMFANMMHHHGHFGGFGGGFGGFGHSPFGGMGSVFDDDDDDDPFHSHFGFAGSFGHHQQHSSHHQHPSHHQGSFSSSSSSSSSHDVIPRNHSHSMSSFKGPTGHSGRSVSTTTTWVNGRKHVVKKTTIMNPNGTSSTTVEEYDA